MVIINGGKRYLCYGFGYTLFFFTLKLIEFVPYNNKVKYFFVLFIGLNHFLRQQNIFRIEADLTFSFNAQ
ncbi:MAG: hypothetical protein C4560_07930 [Nitrospiraceae bacterium]|nr:MAG: hypothetical protein C4560_07930 [Nitrospiraceae bacterium]